MRSVYVILVTVCKLLITVTKIEKMDLVIVIWAFKIVTKSVFCEICFSKEGVFFTPPGHREVVFSFLQEELRLQGDVFLPRSHRLKLRDFNR